MKAPPNVDYRQLLGAASVGDRLKLIKTNVAQDILSQLTPVERAKLFPKYYVDKAASATNAPPPAKSLMDRFLTSLVPPIPDLKSYESKSYTKAEPEPEPKLETKTTASVAPRSEQKQEQSQKNTKTTKNQRQKTRSQKSSS